MKNNLIQKIVFSLIAILFWLGIWSFFAAKADFALILPSPQMVLQRLFELLQTKDFYLAIGASLLRVMWGFSIGGILGFALAFCASHLSPVRILLEPVMGILRAVPVASFILVLLFWTKTEKVPGLISLMMAMPIVYQTTFTGFQERSEAFRELKKAFHIPPVKGFFKVDLPQVFPYVFSGGKTALGLAWKAGIAAEVLALPKVSVGFQIYNAKMYLETTDLYAYTLAIILISLFFEKMMELAFSDRRWRNA